MEKNNISITKKRYCEKMVFCGKYVLLEDIAYPFCEDKKMKRFNRYYSNMFKEIHKGAIDEQYKDARNHYNDIDFETYSLKNDFDIYSWNNILSIVMIKRAFEGGVYEKCCISCENWDVDRDSTVSFEMLFGGNAKFTAVSVIKNQAYYNKKTAKASYYSDYMQQIDSYFNENNFYIDNDEVVFIYPACTIAPCSQGVIKFRVSINRLMES